MGLLITSNFGHFGCDLCSSGEETVKIDFPPRSYTEILMYREMMEIVMTSKGYGCKA